MIEGLLFLLFVVVLGGGAAIAVPAFLRKNNQKMIETRRHELEQEGYVLPVIEECTCPSGIRIEGKTSTGKKVCLFCEKRIID